MCSSLTVTTADGVTFKLNKQQLTHAAMIITVGSSIDGIDRDATKIALMAALTESSLQMLANTGTYPESGDYPNDGNGSDHDSLGLFQMRPPIRMGHRQRTHGPRVQGEGVLRRPRRPELPLTPRTP